MTKLERQMLKDFSFARRLFGKGTVRFGGGKLPPSAGRQTATVMWSGRGFVLAAGMSLKAVPHRPKEKLAESDAPAQSRTGMPARSESQSLQFPEIIDSAVMAPSAAAIPRIITGLPGSIVP